MLAGLAALIERYNNQHHCMKYLTTLATVTTLGDSCRSCAPQPKKTTLPFSKYNTLPRYGIFRALSDALDVAFQGLSPWYDFGVIEIRVTDQL
tara:strand:- start:43 stop:321 length:279 start_codon:yes stop_codon:yes gene_type:complete